MYKTLIKETFREIKKSYSRFIAIIAIIALGISFFVGVKMTCPDMKATANKYFQDNKLMDFQLVSNVGFNKEDIKSLNNIKGINGIMPSYSVDALMDIENVSTVVKINSLPSTKVDFNNKNHLNIPLLVSGRLPNKSGECVIDEKNPMNLNIKLGTKIKITSGDDRDILDYLAIKEFTIVGIINSPLYISKERGTSTIGNGKISVFASILKSDFNMPVYSEIYLTSSETINSIAYSSDYDKKIESLTNDLEQLGIARSKIRYKEIKADANQIIKSKEKKYKEGVLKQKKEILKATNKIKENQNKIDSGNLKLTKNKKIFIKKIADSEKKLKNAKTQLDSGFKTYKANLALFNKSKEQAILAGVYDSQKSIFLAQESLLNSTKTTLDKSLKQFNIEKATLGKAKNNGYTELYKNQKELGAAQSKLNAAKKKLKKSDKESKEKLAVARKKLDKAQNKIDSMSKVKWYVLGRDTNIGYADYGYAADRMNAISRIFPIIFILVAMLICFTSIDRLVNEQRTYIGTLKSLGYRKTAIVFKYLTYAILASVIGGIIGIAIGFTAFPIFFLNVYSELYKFPKMVINFDMLFALVVLIGAILVTSIAAISACLEILPLNAAKLMVPKSPKPGKIIFLERIKFIWKRLKFTQKVTAKNIFRYKSRLFMTVIGVAGCTALLLMGFALKDSIGTIGTKQFQNIYKYQMYINVKDSLSNKEKEKISGLIEKIPRYSSKLNVLAKSVDIVYKNKEKSCNIIVPEDNKKINDFISFQERVTSQKIELNDNGVILTEKLAKMLGVKIGNNIYIKDGDEDKHKVEIIGITENYLQHYLYMSPKLYKQIYKSTPEHNQINIKLSSVSDRDIEVISKNMIGIKGVSSISFNKDILESFNETIKAVNYVVLILIIAAGMLSFIVLYTLTNINISERLRELATIKVLGFYEHEVSSYVYRENIILTVLGSLLGLIMGFYGAKYVIVTSEIDMFMFGRDIYLQSFIFSVLLTLVFSIIVNIFLFKKIKKINMIEALKIME